MQNWLDYNQLKYERNPSKRPTRKVNYADNFNLSFVKHELVLNFDWKIHVWPEFTFPFYQTGFLGLFGEKVDAIDFYTSEIDKLSKEVSGAFWIYA